MRFGAVGLLCAISVTAQVDTGVVSGVVTYRSGAIVPGAAITIRHIETNIQTKLQTNESGFHSAPSLRAARYEIAVKHEGFRPQKSQIFDLRVQDRVEVNFELEVGAANS